MRFDWPSFRRQQRTPTPAVASSTQTPSSNFTLPKNASSVSVIVIVTLVLTLISAVADVNGALDKVQELVGIPEFQPAQGNEILIVIASFHYGPGLKSSDAHSQIRDAIENTARDLGIPGLRVEVESTTLEADERAKAERLGNRYRANIIIWGSDLGTHIDVEFLNLGHPDFAASEIELIEKERIQIADSLAPYRTYITKDLPAQLAFLSLFAIAQSYYIEEKNEVAIRLTEKAIGNLPAGSNPAGLADAYLLLAWLHRNENGDSTKALELLAKAIALLPERLREEHSMYFLARGHTQVDLGNLDSAIEDYERALELDPSLVVAHVGRCVALSEKGLHEQALTACNQAVQQEPQTAYWRMARAMIYERRNEPDKALNDYAQAIHLEPDHAETVIRRGILLLKLRKYVEAEEDFDRILESSPDSPDLYLLRSFARSGTWAGDKEAAQDFAQAVFLYSRQEFRLAPPSNEITATTATIVTYPQDHDQPILPLESIVLAYQNRSRIRAYIGDLEGAVADLGQAIALMSSSAELYYERANDFLLLDDPESSLDDLNSLLNIEPTHAGALLLRATVLKRIGRMAEAVADWQRYLDLYPTASNRSEVETWIAEFQVP